jgi:hypothetical protein
MNSGSTPSTVSLDEIAMCAFQWLLIYGFPPAIAAASARPDVFRIDEQGGDSPIESFAAAA